MRRRQYLFFGLFFLFIVVDQLVKLWARHSLAESQALPFPWPGVFEIELTFNKGIAFGFLQGKGVLLAPIAVVITAGAIVYSVRHPNESRWNHTAFALLAAGAIGNLLDRLVFQRVTDMFWFRPINFPVFNVADSCITIATIMLIIGWCLESSSGKRQKDETLPAEAQ